MPLAIVALWKHLRSSSLQDRRLGFWQGFRAPFQGVGYLLTHPRALALCLAPWAINLLVIFPLFASLGYLLIIRPIRGWLPGREMPLGEWIQAAAMVGLAPMVVVLSLALALMVGAVIGAPFHDALGRHIERRMLAANRPDLLPAEDIAFWPEVRRSIRESAKRMAFFLPRFLLLMLLGLIPIIGPLLALAANLTMTAAFLTLDAFSRPMNRRRVPFETRLGWVVANRWFALGFGLPMLMVPCALFLMPPLATAAATRLYCRLVLDGGEAPGAGTPRPKQELLRPE